MATKFLEPAQQRLAHELRARAWAVGIDVPLSKIGQDLDSWQRRIDAAELAATTAAEPAGTNDVHKWRAGARCVHYDPEIWFPSPRDPKTTDDIAKSICRACPVRLACLAWALHRDERHGIWGGMTTPQRKALQGKTGHRRRNHQSPPVVDADVYASTGI